MKIRLVVTELFRAEERTDIHDEINRSFSQFFEKCLKTVVKIIFLFYRVAWYKVLTHI
jgi:hypothetical protein